MHKYKPQTKEELQKLVEDESIYLGDIDTSLITDMSNLFHESLRKDFSGIGNWNVNNVTSMRGMFYNCYSFNEDISKWNVSNVKNMELLFYNCINFNQPLDKWKTSNLENSSCMFRYAEKFNQNVNHFNMSKVKNAIYMFEGCKEFNQPLDKWDTSNIEYMNGIFKGCTNFNQNLNNWNTSSLAIVIEMFENCINFNQPLNKWNMSKVRHLTAMFKDCHNFNQPLNDWDISKVENMSNMFEGCKSFNQDLDKWDTSNVKSMNSMFWKAKSFNRPLDKWNVSNVNAMVAMFYNSSFKEYASLDTWELNDKVIIDNIFDDVVINNLSLKWILYLYAFDNDNKIIIKKIEENIKEIHKIASEIKNKKVQSAKRKLENIYYDDLKEAVNYEIFDTIEKYEESIKLSKKDEKKISYIKNCNVLIKDKSREVDEKIIKYIYLKYLELKRDIYNFIEIDSIINLLDRESFLTFAKNIYKGTHKETSAIVYSLYGGDEALREIYKKEKDSNFFLIILSSVKTTEYSIELLYDIYSKTKKSELKEEAFYLINNKISKEIGLDIDDLELKFSSNFGLDSRGEKIINDDYKLILNNDYSVKLFDIKNNKELKTTPKNLEGSIKEEIKHIKKEIPDIIKKLYLKLTKSLMYEKKYNYSFFKEVFINNPIMNKFSSSLIWNLYDKDNLFLTTFRYAGDGSYSNCEDEEVKIDNDSFISLASPIEMDDETINKWKHQLEDYELSQPINQLTIIKLDKNNLENEINKLQNIEISYGSFKAFGARYLMSPNYLDFGVVESYNLKNGDSFEIKINANNKIDYKDKVKINIKFYNENNEKVSERFIYTLLILMICDFRLTDIFA
ncbi:BspA family leucine-rich repeat surface protein [Brachyspira sp. SAP_772]|uniref:BspA family leucine-rich repeat surface protein n=1 Tax=Brachyspira sp. SAP_772 TaxID=2608385 RepID=UPI0012F4CA06|nr:BspA family leucine-rich repeat surface protein [Brachyspira sp. SAP_772]